MSHSSLPRELLSAYFDGEVSAEEHAAVSRAVRKSPAAQQTLDDYAQLSESLQALKRDVSSPGLQEAVLAEIQQFPAPGSQPSPLAPPWVQRQWVQVTGGILAAMAVGLILMIWPAGRPGANRDQLAMKAAPDTPPRAELEVARTASSRGLEFRETARAVPGAGPGPERPPAGETSGDPSDRSIADPVDDPDVEERIAMREESIREESLSQFADADGVPERGAVMSYILRVADETVVIPVTVVDVQMTARQIRVLLTEHGIPSLVDEEALPDASLSGDSNMAILVESDDRVYKVMRELDTKGLVESPAMAELRMAVEEADQPGPAAESTQPADSAARAALADAATPPDADRSGTGSESAEGAGVADADLPVIHAWLTAPVTDEFIRQLEQKQQLLHEESAPPAVADAHNTPRQPAGDASPPPVEGDAAPSEAVPMPESAAIHAQPRSTRRILFLIRKSGR